jgi:hypothetical protein|tara:strand:- start:122 stop:520 length:399 start_codon:yes stop_codon:yes gene_type:complete
MTRMPKKTGRCSITGCQRKPTEWHHIIAQGRIMNKGLEPALLSDPGNLVEFCTHHRNMTTASLNREPPVAKAEREVKSQEWIAAKPGPKKEKKKVKPTRCIAETGSGLVRGGRCRLYATSGSDYCHVHNRSR